MNVSSAVDIIYASSLSEILEKTGTTSETGLFGNIGREGGMDSVISVITTIALPLAGSVAIILLIVAGYKMISSQGNPDKLSDAKEMATNAIIGLIFILLSVAILALISNVFNLGIVSE